MHIIPDNIFFHLLSLLVSFLILAKSADFLVDGAVGIASILKIPKMIIGVILVGFATTAPEFTVSLLSAIRGFPEIALGNALGSVIVDDALALALGIVVAPTAIRVEKKSLRWFGIFLISIDVLCFLLSLNGIINRLEGLLLLSILVLYLIVVFHVERKKKKAGVIDEELNQELEEYTKSGGLLKQSLRFLLGVGGVVLASQFLIDSSIFIAGFFGASKALIGLTVVAIGTSLPEIATCITAARKGHGDLAFGDIIGADILNVLWIIGAASLANPIHVERAMILFAFPWMLFVVAVMLSFAWWGYKLQRWKGFVLIAIYLIYLGLSLFRFIF
jgi:cation:H+ antiporter